MKTFKQFFAEAPKPTYSALDIQRAYGVAPRSTAVFMDLEVLDQLSLVFLDHQVIELVQSTET